MKKSIEDTVLEKYHRSQELSSSILKRNNDNQQQQQREQKDIEKQATDVINEFDDIDKQRKKNLKKLKKQFKKQQKQKQKQQQQQIESINIDDNKKEDKCNKSLQYLKQWKKYPNEWKFKKNLHIWLLKNWKNKEIFPDKRFKIFLKYLKASKNYNEKNSSLLRIQQEAKQLLITEDSTEAVNESVCERSQLIVQCLQ